ncbi:ESPR-type extended signal peptide-containing protein [Caballeronia sp. M23-90]
MSKVYRVVWSKSQGAYVVTSELAKSNCKGPSARDVSVSGSGNLAGEIRGIGFPKPMVMALATAALFLGDNPAAWAACTATGATVNCTGAANISYANSANNLTVNMLPGASAGVLLGVGGTAMSLTGSNVTLNNAGTIDPSLLGLIGVLSSGTVIGNGGAASTINVTNSGNMNGTGGSINVSLPTLNGMALAVQNTTGGVTNISNSGTIGASTLLDAAVLPSDAPVVAVFGGGQTNVVNTSTGLITGRVGLQASGTPGTGNTFVNAGTINGSVSMGAGSTNTFTAVTGSSVNASGGLGLSLGVVGINVGFAATGVVDGGLGGNNTLVLQNTATGTGAGTTGTGTVASGTYIDFQHLKVNSGTWTLNGPLGGLADTTLAGGVAGFNDNASFGSGALTSAGGTIQANSGGLNVANDATLQAGGLTVQGTNALTMSGVLSADDQ